MHELALELGKTIQEMTTGEPGMSAHELIVEWPAFNRYRQRVRARKQEAEEHRRRRV